MPTDMLTKDERRDPQALTPITRPAQERELHSAERRQAKRVRRFKLNAAAWGLGTILLTTVWVLNEWQANGAFESFGHEGNSGQWNPTLWALAVGVWGLIVGIMGLRVDLERPTTEVEIDSELERLRPHMTANAAQDGSITEWRRVTRNQVDCVRRLKFHVAAWVLGMIVLTPLWALIEWQDNGGFERWSNKSQPGDWEPWILYIGGIWALVIAAFALRVYFDRPATRARIDRQVDRFRSSA